MYEVEPTAVRATAVEHLREVSAEDRFEFGDNWSRFLNIVNDDRIHEAERSLSAMLGFPLEGKSFVDVGSGSGLFSLAAVWALGCIRLISTRNQWRARSS